MAFLLRDVIETANASDDSDQRCETEDLQEVPPARLLDNRR